MALESSSVGRVAQGHSNQNECLATWLNFTGSVQFAVECKMADLGRMVATHPWRVILGILVMTFICGSGLSQLNTESAGDKLWTPQDSAPALHRDYVEGVPTFGKPPLFESVILFGKIMDKTNVLTVDAIHSLFNLMERINAIRIQGSGGKTIGVQNICVRNLISPTQFGDCLLSDSPLLFWNSNKTQFEQDVINGRTAAGAQQRIIDVVSSQVYPNGYPVKRTNMFAGMQFDPTTNKLISCTGLHMSFLVRNSATLDGNRMDWENAFLDLMKAQQPKYILGNTGTSQQISYKFFFMAGRSLDDELARSIGGDIPLLILTYVVMITFVCSTLGKFDVLHLRASVAFSGVIAIVFAIISAYGLCAYLGVPFTSLTQVLPFIIVGIGVDDQFIVAGAFDRTDTRLSAPDRMAAAYREAGLAVTVTSLTSAAAFLLGALSITPAVIWFCFYAALTILFTYVYMIFMMGALLTIDTRRVAARRIDCMCLCLWPCRRRIIKQDSALELQKRGDEEQDDVETFKPEMPFVTRFFHDWYGPFIVKPKVRIFIIILFVSLLAFSAYSTTKVTQGFELLDITPDVSYVRDFIQNRRAYFSAQSLFFTLYFKDLLYNDRTVQEQVIQYIDDNLNSRWVEGPAASWIHAYKAFYSSHAPFNASVDADGWLTGPQFYMGMKAFLVTPGGLQFNGDIYWNADKTQLLASRVRMFLIPMVASDVQRDALLATRSITERSPLNVGRDDGNARAFSYTFYFLFWETFTIMYGQLVQNFVLTGVAIFVICIFLLVRPSATLLVIIVVAMIDVNLLASVDWWGLKVNSITVINLTMAIGLVVDYCAHIMHSFLHQKHGTKSERVVMALTNMGSAILLGGSTTMLGVLPLSLSGSTVFRVFFRMFVGIIGFALVHGLVLLPAVLSLIGPDPVPPRHEKSDDDHIDVE